MANFSEKFEFLKRESDEYFRTEFKSTNAETKENVRIKSTLLALIIQADESGNNSISDEAKWAVIEFLCEVCGHAEDLEILRNHTPSILAPEELEYIIQNSAPSRWF